MFHVERNPIEKAPSKLRTTRNQIVNFRIYNLQRQRVCQSRSALATSAVDANLQPLPAVSNPEFLRSSLGLRFAKQHELRLPMPNEVRC